MPSFTSGTLGNERLALISNDPAFRVYKSLIIINKSDVVFTGRNLLLGTLIPKKGKKEILSRHDQVSKEKYTNTSIRQFFNQIWDTNIIDIITQDSITS